MADEQQPNLLAGHPPAGKILEIISFFVSKINCALTKTNDM